MTTSASLGPAVLVSAVNKGGMCGKSIKYIMSQLSSDRQGKGSKGDLKTVLCFFSGLHFEEKSWKRLLGTNCHPWSWFHNFQMPVFNKQDQKLPLTTRRRLAHNIFDVFATSVDKIEEESLQIWKLCFIFSVDYVLKDEAEKERLHIKWTPKSFPQR